MKLILLTLLALFSVAGVKAQETIWVDANVQADAKQNGTAKKPFATFEQAFGKLKYLKAKTNKYNVEIVLREGTYYIDKSYYMTSALSNVTIRANNNGAKMDNVVFSGGVEIPINSLKWTSVGGKNMYEINLKELGVNDFGEIKNVGFARPIVPAWGELFVNGESMHLARWPNKGMIRMGKVVKPGSVPRNGDFTNQGATIKYDSARISSWKPSENMWISGYFHYGYADDALNISKIDTAKNELSTNIPTMYGFNSSYHWNRYYIFNVLEELDVPGEYYIDYEAGLMYFLPPTTQGVEKLDFTMLEKPFFDIYGAHNLNIEGITFEYTRAIAITMLETQNVNINKCVFRNSGSLAIMVGYGISPFAHQQHEGTGNPDRNVLGSLMQHIYENPTFNRMGGNNNTISNCEFYHLGAGAVVLGGGSRNTLEMGNNTIENSVFHNNNRVSKSYRPHIDLTCVGNNIRNCELYDAPSMAILLHGNNHTIENNYIHNVCQEVEDQGAIYYGRDPSECGNVIKDNLIAHIPSVYNTCAIYHDDGAGGMEVEGNIIYNGGKWDLLIGGGSDIVYRDNIFINSKYVAHIDTRLQGWGKAMVAKDGIMEMRLKAVNYTKPPYSVQYPYLLNGYVPNTAVPRNVLFEDNVFYGIDNSFDAPKLLTEVNNRVIKEKLVLDGYSMKKLLNELVKQRLITDEKANMIGVK